MKPPNALLATYDAQGEYIDCYLIDAHGDVQLSVYVEALYTSRLFKLERFVLHRIVRKPSTDLEARQLAAGEREDFAAWSLAGRTPDELLMHDYQGKTSSWFKVESLAMTTRLYFGTVIMRKAGTAKLSFGFRLLLPFHRLYSRGLLNAAKSRLERLKVSA